MVLTDCVTVCDWGFAQPGPLMTAGIYFSDNNKNSFVGHIQMGEALAPRSPFFIPFLVVEDEMV